jgi:hypothetical protein
MTDSAAFGNPSDTAAMTSLFLKPIGFELENTTSFRQQQKISKRFHRTEKK